MRRIVRHLARRYRELESAGYTDGLLTVVCIAGAVALGGVVLLASIQTRAALIIALALAVLATLAVLVTVFVMLSDDEPARPSTRSRPPRH